MSSETLSSHYSVGLRFQVKPVFYHLGPFSVMVTHTNSDSRTEEFPPSCDGKDVTLRTQEKEEKTHLTSGCNQSPISPGLADLVLSLSIVNHQLRSSTDLTSL